MYTGRIVRDYAKNGWGGLDFLGWGDVDETEERVFLEIVNGGGIDGDAGNLTTAALYEDTGAGLATVESGAEFEIADSGVANGAGSVLVSDAEEIGAAGGDAGVGAVDDEAGDGDVGGVGD